MSTTDLLIADYLKRKGFSSTLKSFESELGIISHPLNYEPLEDIVQDRLKYLDHDINNDNVKPNNKIEHADIFSKWKDDSRITKNVLMDHDQLIIHISKGVLKINNELKKVVFITSSDKKLTIIDLESLKVIRVLENLHTSVGKCSYVINGSDKFLSCGMDGKIKLFKLDEDKVSMISEVQLHKRLVTDFKVWIDQDDGTPFICSIGWDFQLKISRIVNDSIEIISNFKLLSNATSIELGIYRKTPIVFLTRLDSTQLSLFTFKQPHIFEISRISLNDAEFSTHGFTPMSISLTSHKLDSNTFIAVGTSHVPYMRLIIIKLPPLDPLLTNLEIETEQHLTSAQVHRGLIIGNYNTLSPQDKYSQGVVHWRNDGSGVWISGDDGIIRGLDLKNGEVVQEHKGHDKRIKCLVVDELQGQGEVLISSGIDKKLIYWS